LHPQSVPYAYRPTIPRRPRHTKLGVGPRPASGPRTAVDRTRLAAPQPSRQTGPLPPNPGPRLVSRGAAVGAAAGPDPAGDTRRVQPGGADRRGVERRNRPAAALHHPDLAAPGN